MKYGPQFHPWKLSWRRILLLWLPLREFPAGQSTSSDLQREPTFAVPGFTLLHGAVPPVMYLQACLSTGWRRASAINPRNSQFRTLAGNFNNHSIWRHDYLVKGYTFSGRKSTQPVLPPGFTLGSNHSRVYVRLFSTRATQEAQCMPWHTGIVARAGFNVWNFLSIITITSLKR